eukprot:10235989-Lingulodinium_polyedra.AAC.1
MNDPGKASLALADWERDNPEGCARMKLICWASFKKRYGVRVAYTYREGEVQMGIDDYWVLRGKPYGRTRDESDAEFMAKVDVAVEKEGEGVDPSQYAKA